MALESLPSQEVFTSNFSALPSEDTPLFAHIEKLSEEASISITNKATEIVNKLVSKALQNKEENSLETHEDHLKSTILLAINPEIEIPNEETEINLSDMDKLKIVALTTAFVTKQESMTVTRIVAPKKDAPELYRGLSLDIGEPVTKDMAQTIHHIAKDIDPTLEFSVHGDEVRFVNFDQKNNQEFIRSVREVASSLPVETVEMRRFMSEGFKISNDYSQSPKGSEYLRELTEMGMKNLAASAMLKSIEFDEYIREEASRDPQELKGNEDAINFKVLKKEDQLGFDFEL